MHGIMVMTTSDNKLMTVMDKIPYNQTGER